MRNITVFSAWPFLKVMRGFLACFVLGVFSVLMPINALANICTKPVRPAIPDVNNTTDVQMSDTLLKMEQYQQDMNGYLDCLDREFTAARSEGLAAIKAWNDAVDAFQARP